ncbi:diguanylate cyclase domain-containing protein [Halanaerobacter jeridensis]|uniref:Diguanylate cyclase (GGDEF)-like protein n=1 Tax=Halanaerobacter jeridensis TaxID=706427 RepID=A0A939BQ58_9FIRM|nr:diguanylate cyclase [Halanaerobacter jeridensis]MBM7555939.1 diguanylate cyclase (GGDEF)-like protein [Halanaerobacter jeridensis]
MEVFNILYQNQKQLYYFIEQSKIYNSDKLLIQIFTDHCNYKYIKQLLWQLKIKLPAAKIIGATSSEGIVNAKKVKGSTVISFSQFKTTDLEVALVKFPVGDYYQQAQNLGERIIKTKSKALILFADGIHANGEKVLSGIEKIDREVIVAGGKAGRNNDEQQTFIFTADEISNRGIVGVSLNNKDLTVNTGYGFGWQQIGKTMTVTKADGNRLYELDNENIDEVYKRYLGEEIAANLPQSAEMEFPIVLNRDGVLIVRGAISKENNSLAFTGEIHEGEEVKFGYGNPKMILQNGTNDLNKLTKQSLDGVYIYSCVSRASLLGEDIELEFTPLQAEAPTAGFFTFGEFYHKERKNYFFNKTTTVLALSEGTSETNDKLREQELDLDDKWHYRTIKALANLAQSMTDELEARNKELKKLNEEVNKNLNLSETGQAIIEIGCEQLKVEHGAFILDSEDNFETTVLTGFSHAEEKKLNKILTQFQINELNKTEQKIIVYNQQQGFLLSQLQYKSALLAPISTNNTTAVIFFLHPQANFFNAKDKLLIEPLINQAPLAIEKANTFEHMERNLAELSILQQTSSQINSTLNLEEVFELAIDVIKGTMGVAVVGLFLLEDGELELAAQSGLESESKLFECAQNSGFETIKDNQTIIMNNISAKFIDCEEICLKSALTVPINIRDECIGVIFSGHTQSNSIFQTEDKKFINILSNQVAIGIENARMYEEMEELAVQDGLTKLYNHSYFQKQLANKIKSLEEKNSNFGLLLLDIDNFKYFNDQYGHQAGDQILRELAVKLKSLTRTGDLLARYGGEEFVIILSDVTRKEVKKLGQRVTSQIREMKIDYGGQIFQITISIGGSIYEKDKTKKELIEEADKALYKAKEKGKDQFCLN